MGDTAYTVLEPELQAQAQRVTPMTTGRLDAVLHASPPERTEHTIGRPHVIVSAYLLWRPCFRTPKRSGRSSLRTGTVKRSEPWRSVRAPPCGSALEPIRWVLTRDPLGKRPAKAIFSTDPAQTAEQIIQNFMKRWSLEVTVEEGRAHLGIETQQQ